MPYLRILVYGTLKRGHGNHGLLEGAEFAGTGVVYGRLHGQGIPFLKPAPKTVMAVGTASFAADAARQAEEAGCAPPEPGRGGWSRIRGEVYLVRDPAMLARLDRLEGFRPGGRSLYTRVLVAANTDAGARAVWVYGMDAPRGDRLVPPEGEKEVSWPAFDPTPRAELAEGKHRIFAYGSLLLSQDARRTAPKAIWRGRALLPAHRLALTLYSAARSGGVADAVPDAKRGVWGGIYEVGPRGLARLDAREGHPGIYRRELVTVWLDGQPDTPVEAWVYRVVNREEKAVPASAAYKSIIADGARKRGLPKAYIRNVIDRLPVDRGAKSPLYRDSVYEAGRTKSLANGGLFPDPQAEDLSWSPWWDRMDDTTRLAVGSRW